MFNAEIREMLAEVIRSWQVIVVTVVILIYISIVRKVARLDISARRRSEPKKRKPKKEKVEDSLPSESDEPGLGSESESEEESVEN